MKTSDVYPAAASLVRAMLKVMIDTRSTSADDLRRRADWAYGAEKIAAAMGDHDAANLLRTNGELLRDLASRQPDPEDVLVELDVMTDWVPIRDNRMTATEWCQGLPMMPKGWESIEALAMAMEREIGASHDERKPDNVWDHAFPGWIEGGCQ